MRMLGLAVLLLAGVALGDVGPSTGSVRGSGAANEVALWKNYSTLYGSSSLTFDGTTLSVTGNAYASSAFGFSPSLRFTDNGSVTDYNGGHALRNGSFTGTAGAGSAAFYASAGGTYDGVSTGILRGEGVDGATAVGAASDSLLALTTPGAKIHSFRNAGTEKAYVDKDGRPAFVLTTDSTWIGNASNVGAEAAIPSCSATNSTLQYSTTTHALSCSTSAAVASFWNDSRFGAFTADTNWLGGYYATKGTEKAVDCLCQSYGTAGSGGSTAMAIQLWDVGNASATATDNTGFPCNTAVRTPTRITFASASLVAGHRYVLRENTKGNCTTGPTDMECTCNFTP